MSSKKNPAVDKQPRDVSGPVFSEPWEARTFALAIHLHDRGAFSWPEWVDALSDEITQFEKRGGVVVGSQYYRLWQQALEKLVDDKF